MVISNRGTVRENAVPFHISRLELAPEGWRRCVEQVAEGFFYEESGNNYCALCGRRLDGMQGHDAACLTMAARRILANEPLLHAKRQATFQAVDIEVALPATQPTAKEGQGPMIVQPTRSYAVPRFLEDR